MHIFVDIPFGDIAVGTIVDQIVEGTVFASVRRAEDEPALVGIGGILYRRPRRGTGRLGEHIGRYAFLDIHAYRHHELEINLQLTRILVIVLVAVAGAIEAMGAHLALIHTDRLDEVLELGELQRGETQALGNLIDHALILG